MCLCNHSIADVPYFELIVRRCLRLPLITTIDAPILSPRCNTAKPPGGTENHHASIHDQPGGCLVYKNNDTNGPWERTGREMEPSAEPYYFVWTKPEQQKTRHLPRIPQVTLISLVPFKEALGPITPGRNASEQARRGYELVTDKYDCLGCHRINGHGGKVALDLARPQNVTSYLPVDLIKKIL
jgi:hypothetical protein